jgi:hypothetical protein
MELYLYNTDIKLTLADQWEKVDKRPGDPENLSIIGFNHETCSSLVFLKPITKDEIIPIGNKQLTIEGIRHFLKDNQGIIEVNTVTDKYPYIYTILKTLMEPGGVQYVVTFYININENYFHIQGFFDEAGRTGIRDAVVFESCRREGVASIDEKTKEITGWFCDPYDASYRNGALMNFGEQEVFDEHFQFHPLSQARKFIKELLSNFDELYKNK